MKQWFRNGTPWIWLTAGAVSISVIMVVGLLGLIAVRGLSHFWPANVAQVEIVDLRSGENQKVLGEIIRSETIPAAVAREAGNYVPDGEALVTRYLFKQGNRDQHGRDFVWHFELGMQAIEYPPQAYTIERRGWGNFYGFAQTLLSDGKVVAQAGDNDFTDQLQQAVTRSLELHAQIKQLERGEIGSINTALERLRLDTRRLDLDNVSGPERDAQDQRIDAERQRLDNQYQVLREELNLIYTQLNRDSLQMVTIDDTEVTLALSTIVRATQPNNLSVLNKSGQYIARVWEFLSTEPREANTEGGIFPAIFGTITMVFIMAIMVTPFGVLAAIYLREYAKQGLVTRIIRISVYNLAGVPSIVYGVFGLGFFIYFLGGNIDQLFYPEAMPSPTFGTPGLFWASLTLALLTLPVVIVSTEEGLARIPSTIRQGSLALGATKSETLWKVVVPLATPAMMTGLILAIARAAGEVAPLMLVGVVKLAPTLPIDSTFPFVHLERKIMHLGFHIYDVGFQSPNVEAARPLVYATALTLVVLIVLLNLAAIGIRNRLREKYRSDTD